MNAAHPGLQADIRLFHNGQQVFAGKTPLAPDGEQRLKGQGLLALGKGIAPGEYVLQVVVTDKLAKGKFTTVTRSLDFEIEP